MINVQLQVDGPITEMDETQFERREGTLDTDREYTSWVEFYVPGDYSRPVHRSVQVKLKRGLGIEGVLGRIG